MKFYVRLIVAVLAVCCMCLFSRPAGAATRLRPLNPMPAGWPKLISIPRIAVRAPVESLPLTSPAQAEAPFRWGDVVWYDRGPRPGEMGRSNFFGHLDSRCCPAIFYHLRDLRKGDRIYVAYRDGRVVTFQVQWQGVYWDNKLPVKFMYATTRERGIVLTTCTGVFHRDGTGYDHRLIVYATLVWPHM